MKLKNFKELIKFELNIESYLVENLLKPCDCSIKIRNECVICGKQKAL